MKGLAKTAGVARKVTKFVTDFTGTNEAKAHQHLLDTMKAEKEKKVPASAVSHAIKHNAIANEDKFKARKQGAIGAGIGLAGAAGAGMVAKKKKTRLESEEGL